MAWSHTSQSDQYYRISQVHIEYEFQGHPQIPQVDWYGERFLVPQVPDFPGYPQDSQADWHGKGFLVPQVPDFLGHPQVSQADWHGERFLSL